jgi:hypothetical protein
MPYLHVVVARALETGEYEDPVELLNALMPVLSARGTLNNGKTA